MELYVILQKAMEYNDEITTEVGDGDYYIQPDLIYKDYNIAIETCKNLNEKYYEDIDLKYYMYDCSLDSLPGNLKGKVPVDCVYARNSEIYVSISKLSPLLTLEDKRQLTEGKLGNVYSVHAVDLV